jgi:hypothetical protein
MSDALLKIRFLGLMILLCINYILIQILIGMVWTQKEGLEVYLSCGIMNLLRLQIFNLVHIGY